METAASYTETKIKTYGFETKFNQCICQLSFGADQCIQMDPVWSDSGRITIPFEMVFMGPPDQCHCHLSIVISNHQRNAFRQFVLGIESQPGDIDVQFTAPVELLYFFGPHFGDRFGIADFTFNALAENNLSVIAASFSSASIFLVLPEHGALKAKAIFANLFEIPKTIQRPSFMPINRRNRIQKQ